MRQKGLILLHIHNDMVMDIDEIISRLTEVGNIQSE